MVFTLLATRAVTTDTTSYVTASTFTPAANALVLAAVLNSKASAPDLPSSLTSTGGLTFVQVLTTNFNSLASPAKRLTIYRAQAASPTESTVVISFGATQTGCTMAFCEFQNADDSAADGANAIVQSVANGGDSSDPLNISMAAVDANSKNAVAVFMGNSQVPFGGTPQSNWTEDFDGGYATPNTGLNLTHIMATTSNSVSIDLAGSTAWAGLALEIKQKP